MFRKAFLRPLLVAASFLPCLLTGCSREKEERDKAERDDAVGVAKLLLESTLPIYIDIAKNTFKGNYIHRSAGSSDGTVRFRAQIEATEDLYEPKPRSLKTQQLLADVQTEDRRVSALLSEFLEKIVDGSGASLEVRDRLDTELKKLRNDVWNFTTVEIVTKKTRAKETQEIFGTATVLSYPRMRADKLELETKVDLGKPLAHFTRGVRVGEEAEEGPTKEIAEQLASVRDAFVAARIEIDQAKKNQKAGNRLPNPPIQKSKTHQR